MGEVAATGQGHLPSGQLPAVDVAGEQPVEPAQSGRVETDITRVDGGFESRCHGRRPFCPLAGL
jgi:hypothetical protein